MSLKAFHIFFVTIATLASGGFGVWLIRHYQVTHSAVDLLLAILAILGTLALPVYGVWFLKKTKHVGYV